MPRPPRRLPPWTDGTQRPRLITTARLLADRFGAVLRRTEHSQRVGWDRDGRSVYGILLPDPLPSAYATDADWFIYYVWGETLFRRTHKEREKVRECIKSRPGD